MLEFVAGATGVMMRSSPGEATFSLMCVRRVAIVYYLPDQDVQWQAAMYEARIQTPGSVKRYASERVGLARCRVKSHDESAPGFHTHARPRRRHDEYFLTLEATDLLVFLFRRHAECEFACVILTLFHWLVQHASATMHTPTQVWDSDNDDGDHIFEDYDTVATLPVSRPDQPSQIGATAPSTYITQPTQPIPRSPPTSDVQVLASSPPPLQASSPRGPSVAPLKQGALNGIARPGIASLMAPPGTQFRAPAHGWQTAESQRGPELTQSSQIIHSDSSDDDELSNNIRPTSFDKGTSRGPLRVEESPKSNAFGAFASTFAYNGSPASQLKRSSDAMADGYGNASRKVKAPRVDEAVPQKQFDRLVIADFSDIPDASLRGKALRISVILPTCSAEQIYRALMLKKSHQGDAMTWLMEQDEHKPGKGQTVDLTKSEDERKASPQQARPSAKRGVQGQVRSINQKWSSAQSREQVPASTASTSFIDSLLNRGQEPAKRQAPPSKPIGEKWGSTAKAPVQQSSQDDPSTPLKKPRKRLVQGRKNPVESSPAHVPTPVVVNEDKAPSITSQQQKKAVVIESDDEEAEASDSGVGSDDNGIARDDILEAKILSFINSCTVEDLIDVSCQPPTNAGKVLDGRPYNSMDEIRAVVHETTSTTKTGKTRTAKQPVGQRLCDVLEDMFEGYEAVDELVRTCEELGKPVATEMKAWGFDAFGTAQEGELQLMDLTSAHDSGIGTPSSSTGSAEDEDAPRPRIKARRLLQQPSVMSSDLVMKDYQVAGLNWLALLFSKKLSCILADDMGLGKTCQVIAFLAHLFESDLSKGPHLVIVPGSTLENWLREFQNFCPKLRVEPYYGKQAERAEMQLTLRDQIEKINVIVTTYDMASKRDDASFLRKLKPVVCVYDEGHALKNSQSQRYKELMRIPAQFRLLLTGTPLQNNLQELISLLAFIMPNIFVEKEEVLANIFKYRAKTTDTEHTALLNSQRISKARSMMTPFILRRKKHQVLKHLPKKTTSIVRCDLAEDQKTLYAERSAEARAVLLQGDGEDDVKKKRRTGKPAGANESTKLTNNVLMDLRKAAIHPLLFRRHYTDDILRKLTNAYCKTHPDCNFDFVFEDLAIMTDFELNRWCQNEQNSEDINIVKHKLDGTPWMASGKVTKLLELLKRHIKNGDRTLVFSQFTMVMDVLELVFETANIGFYRLDGSTAMHTRQDLLDQFRDDDTPVFMLSTKAGGAGINLACANKVIIFDMSFNPQDDVQAENRAHRVGQTREVEVVRLVSNNTIEEQILRLGESKLALDAQVAGETEVAKGGDDKEKKGVALVEAMMKAQLTTEGTSKEAEVKEDAKDTAEGPKPKSSDIKADYLDSLKAAGLDMSAAAA